MQNCNELVDSSKFLVIESEGESNKFDPSKCPAKIPMLFQGVGVPELPAQKDLNHSALSKFSNSAMNRFSNLEYFSPND